YIDLRTKTVYDYSSFSDTAILLTKRFLPDTMFMDYGWNFNQISKVVGNPVELSDTTIENVNYKRAKFSTEEYDKDKVYQIGYFTCDNKGLLFSLKKSFSFKPNCTMTKIFGYNVGVPTPFASKELVFVSEELSNYEKQVFKSWKQNIKLFPVNQ
ncbi:MAG: hypothetical protein H0V91_05230, partial [Flavisolibacter sp.]|nr:hypothetical protein [Flavisolibacter sp.]